MKTTANILCMTASLEFGLQCSVIFLFILHHLHLYCSPNFARFYFLLAFRTDIRSPSLCFFEPTATFARRIYGKKRFFIIGIKQLLAMLYLIFLDNKCLELIFTIRKILYLHLIGGVLRRITYDEISHISSF